MKTLVTLLLLGFVLVPITLLGHALTRPAGSNPFDPTGVFLTENRQVTSHGGNATHARGKQRKPRQHALAVGGSGAGRVYPGA